MVAARFLLKGVKSGLKSDEISRISIKNLSLETISLCVRLDPEILHLSLQVDDGGELVVPPLPVDKEEDNVDGKDYSPPKDYQNEELAKGDDSKEKDEKEKLLDIKFDHFGDEDENASGYFYDFNLESVSADQREYDEMEGKLMDSKGIMVVETTAEAEHDDSKHFDNLVAITLALDLPETDKQDLADVLLYWTHCDPMLRAHVQIIVGNYFLGESSDSVNLDYLLGILIKVSFLIDYFTFHFLNKFFLWVFGNFKKNKPFFVSILHPPNGCHSVGILIADMRYSPMLIIFYNI